MAASPTLDTPKTETRVLRIGLPSRENLVRLLGSPWFITFLLTFALYWRALFFPFYWDDIPNFEFLTTRTFLQIWTNISGFPHYRPVVFTLWKIGLALFPPAPTFLFHAAVLVVQAVNGVLVGRLTRHFILIGQPDHSATRLANVAGWLASVLFVTYPFAVIAVASNAAFFHPAVTLVSLSAVTVALKFLQSPKERWFLLTLFLTTLAPYVHESGIMAGGLASLALTISDQPFAWRSKWRLGLWTLSSLLFVLVRMMVPKSQSPLVWVGWDSIGASLAFFTQGWTYPFQIVTRPLLIERLGLSDTNAVWIIALLALVGAVGIILRRRQWPALLFALGWFGLIITPSAFALNFSYIYAAPWLLYSLAPGAAMLWATVCFCLGDHLSQLRLRLKAPLILGLAACAIAPPLFFIQREVNLYQVALTPVQQLAAIAHRYPPGRSLIINPLDWLAYQAAWYPLEHEGIEVMPLYVGMPGLARINSGIPGVFEGTRFPPLEIKMANYLHSLNSSGGIQDWASLAKIAPTYDRIWVMSYSNAGIALEEAGTVKNAQAQSPPSYLAGFERKVFLTSGDYQIEGDEISLTLNWKYLGPDPDATIFRHVLDCAGNVLGLGDGHALGRMLMFPYLTPGAEIRDVRRMPLEALAVDGCYSIEIGLFRPDGSRVTALAPDGTPFANAVVTLH